MELNKSVAALDWLAFSISSLYFIYPVFEAAARPSLCVFSLRELHHTWPRIGNPARVSPSHFFGFG